MIIAEKIRKLEQLGSKSKGKVYTHPFSDPPICGLGCGAPPPRRTITARRLSYFLSDDQWPGFVSEVVAETFRGVGLVFAKCEDGCWFSQVSVKRITCVCCSSTNDDVRTCGCIRRCLDYFSGIHSRDGHSTFGDWLSGNIR